METSSNNSDNYVLSDTELKILEVCLDPTNSGKSVVNKCKLAGVSRDTWYKVMKRPEFAKVLNEAALETVRSRINDVVAATLKFAVKNSKCSADRKVLLAMAGLYKEKQEIESTNFNLNKDVSQMTDEELAAEIAKYNTDVNKV